MISRRLNFVVIAVLFLLSFPAYADEPVNQKPVLKTGFSDFPPYIYVDRDGNASGPGVGLTEKVAAEAGYRIQWVYLPIARVYLYLKTGKIDLWPGVAGIPSLRDHVYEGAATPMQIILYAFHLSGTKAPDSLKALEGEPLILINGFNYLGALRDLSLEEGGLSYAPDHAAALRMLKLGRGRYLLDYDAPVRAVKHKFPDLEITGTPIFTARGAFVVSRTHPDAREVISKFDRAYLELVEKGDLETLQ